jgi:hypothetical protein
VQRDVTLSTLARTTLARGRQTLDQVSDDEEARCKIPTTVVRTFRVRIDPFSMNDRLEPV